MAEIGSEYVAKAVGRCAPGEGCDQDSNIDACPVCIDATIREEKAASLRMAADKVEDEAIAIGGSARVHMVARELRRQADELSPPKPDSPPKASLMWTCPECNSPRWSWNADMCCRQCDECKEYYWAPGDGHDREREGGVKPGTDAEEYVEQLVQKAKAGTSE